MKNADTLSLMHERVDDIPLLLGFMQELNLPDLLERHLGSHHLHKGLSNGWLATVWLAFLLSQSNHRKVSVQDWAQNHVHTLETLIAQRLRRPIEFADDRLSIILRGCMTRIGRRSKRTFGKPPAKSMRSPTSAFGSMRRLRSAITRSLPTA